MEIGECGLVGPLVQLPAEQGSIRGKEYVMILFFNSAENHVRD